MPFKHNFIFKKKKAGTVTIAKSGNFCSYTLAIKKNLLYEYTHVISKHLILFVSGSETSTVCPRSFI